MVKEELYMCMRKLVNMLQKGKNINMQFIEFHYARKRNRH